MCYICKVQVEKIIIKEMSIEFHRKLSCLELKHSNLKKREKIVQSFRCKKRTNVSANLTLWEWKWLRRILQMQEKNVDLNVTLHK